MGTVRFNLRIDKPDKEGRAPIELIYQIHGQRKYYSTGKKLYPENWNTKNQEGLYLDKKTAKKLLPLVDYNLFPSSEEIKEINNDLTALGQSIADIEKRFELDKIVYSAKMVIEVLSNEKSPKTKKEQPSKYIYDFIDKYIEDNKTTRVKGSLNVYSSLKSHLQSFQKSKNVVVAFTDIDHTFFQKFQNYLLNEGGIRYSAKGLTNTTVAKQLSTLKTFLSYARSSGIEVSDKYRLFKIKKDEGAVIALTDEEFKALLNYEFPIGSTQDHVRNAFCFSCTAGGLRYSDLKQLTWDHIKEDEVIVYVIKKGKRVPHSVPLTSYSRAILEKYKGKPYPLKVISNQRMNDHLKGNEDRNIKSICEIAGITDPTETVSFRGAIRESEILPKFKLVGVHTGRKTFVTLSLERGMTAEEVMPVSGHESYASFKRYVNITDQRKKKAMSKAWG